MFCVGFAIGAPSVRQEIAPWNRNIAGISELGLPVTVLREEGHFYYMADAIFEGLAGGPNVSWVFIPKLAQASFH